MKMPYRLVAVNHLLTPSQTLPSLSFLCKPLLTSNPASSHAFPHKLFLPPISLSFWSASAVGTHARETMEAVLLLLLAAVLSVAGAPPKAIVIDITHRYVARGMPNYASPKGDECNSFDITLNTHWGTHLDAPGHFNRTLLDMGYDVNHLDPYTLTGPCLVVETPKDQNVTEEVMKELDIPRGVKRVLFKTLNTDRGLMHKPEFDGSYTAFTTAGARYLVANTDIKLVGIDYLSMGVGVEEEVIGVYLTLLNMKDIIPVELVAVNHLLTPLQTLPSAHKRNSEGVASLGSCSAFLLSTLR